MASDREIKGAIEKVFKIDKLKEKQKAITMAALKKEDCIAILPTGYGKSLPYQMLIPLRRMLQIPGADRTNFGKIVVCSPIIALMQDQMDRLNSIPNVKAVYTGRCYFVFIEGSRDRTKMPMQLPLIFQAFISYKCMHLHYQGYSTHLQLLQVRVQTVSRLSQRASSII